MMPIILRTIFIAKQKALLILAISLANFWIYHLIQINLLVASLLIVESILLYLSVFLRLKTLTVLTFVLLSILSVYFIAGYADKNIFLSSDVEVQKIGKRHEYYAQELGKIYKNRIGIFYFNNLRLSIGKLGNNLFSSLDFVSYFPSKYPLMGSLLFFIGLLYFLVNIEKRVAIYFLIASAASSLISFNSQFSAVLFFPFVNLCIAIGLLKLLAGFKNRLFS